MLTAATGGVEDAFGVLWHDLQPRLLRYCKLIAPGAAAYWRFGQGERLRHCWWTVSSSADDTSA